MQAANLLTFLKFGNAKKSDICVSFAKNHGWPWNWGGWNKTGPTPQPRPKTVTAYGRT